jgi:hypothetical protein
MSEKDITTIIQHTKGYRFILGMCDRWITYHVRLDQPCYGELRKYKSTHKGDADWDENKPTDLYHPFPKGTPHKLWVGFYADILKEEAELIFMDPDSPWRSGVKNPGLIPSIRKEGYVSGLYTWTEINPTVLVQALRWVSRFGYCERDILPYLTGSELKTYQKILLRAWNKGTGSACNLFCKPEIVSPMMDITRFKDGNPKDKMCKRRLSARGDYKREGIEDLWRGDNEVLLPRVLPIDSSVEKMVAKLKEL